MSWNENKGEWLLSGDCKGLICLHDISHSHALSTFINNNNNNNLINNNININNNNNNLINIKNNININSHIAEYYKLPVRPPVQTYYSVHINNNNNLINNNNNLINNNNNLINKNNKHK